MQFTTLALCALSAAGALAQSTSKTATSSAAKTSSTGSATGMTTVHVVKVGSANGSLVFAPNEVKAVVGDMVQFQFAPNNHTVTQSTFDAPCQPIAMNSNVTGIYSGFMPVSAASTTTPTYTIMVNNTTPMWLYCSQGKHCQNGMVMVINVNPTANASRTLANYASLAKAATANLAPGAVSGGVSGTNSTSGSGTGTETGTGTSTETGTGTSGSASATASKSSSAIRTTESFSLIAGLVVMGFALLL
ncbi:Cupredoxin [Halenospora varia]|nr:Cupredoxin [Halenospora varia]